VPAALGTRAQIVGAIALALENTDVFDRAETREEERAGR
jgi:hypothetical protein